MHHMVKISTVKLILAYILQVYLDSRGNNPEFCFVLITIDAGIIKCH